MEISAAANPILVNLERARAIAARAIADPSAVTAEQLALGEHHALSAADAYKVNKDFMASRHARLGAAYLGQAVEYALMQASSASPRPELAEWIRGSSSAAVQALESAAAMFGRSASAA